MFDEFRRRMVNPRLSVAERVCLLIGAGSATALLVISVVNGLP